MTDRGLPIVDGAPACPFVAFEDDRDGRSQAPDHRHRCFAEPRPAPRALAHQEAYCLSSAFPVCPTFQDWARREAAAARPAEAAPDGSPDEAPVSHPMPRRELEPRHAQTDTPPPIPARRNPPRDWAAPPPWSSDASPGDRPGEAAPPSFLADAEAERARGRDAWGADSRGLAGSPADRLAGGDPGEPGARAAWAAVAPAAGAGAASLEESLLPAAAPPPRRSPGRATDRRRDRGQADAPRQRHVRPHTDDEAAAELFGPAWEAPRRYEAYPTLRTRVGLPALPPLAVGAAALVLAAMVLFFVGPMILGIGGGGFDLGGAPPSATASPLPTLAPTPIPEPTPQLYVVARGDTMSSIATRFGVTLDQLLAANPQIKNPNRIKVGDELTIPVPVTDQSGGE